MVKELLIENVKDTIVGRKVFIILTLGFILVLPSIETSATSTEEEITIPPARKKAVEVQNAALKNGTEVVKTYQRGVISLAKGDEDWENLNYERTKFAFITAEGLFSLTFNDTSSGYTRALDEKIPWDKKIKNAKMAAEKGDIRTAYLLLNNLSQKDQSISAVKKLKKDIIALDKEPPLIVHKKGKPYKPNKPIIITAKVQDNLEVSQVWLNYKRKGAKEYTMVEMKPEKKGAYIFSIPADYPQGKEVRYYFTATDINGNNRSLGSKKQLFKIKRADKGPNIPQIP